MSNISQMKNRTLKVKQKFANFLRETQEESVYFNKFEKFLKKFYIFVSPTLEDYVNDNKPKKRRYILFIIRFAGFLTALRFGTSMIFNNEWVSMVMSDANYLLGNQRMISCLICLAFLSLNVLIGGWIQYMEHSNILAILNYLYSIKIKTIDNRLIPKYRLRFLIQFRFITKFLLEKALYRYQ